MNFVRRRRYADISCLLSAIYQPEGSKSSAQRR